jgi:hypothetical protein
LEEFDDSPSDVVPIFAFRIVILAKTFVTQQRTRFVMMLSALHRRIGIAAVNAFWRNALVSTGSKTLILPPFNWPRDLFPDQERAVLFGGEDEANG